MLQAWEKFAQHGLLISQVRNHAFPFTDTLSLALFAFSLICWRDEKLLCNKSLQHREQYRVVLYNVFFFLRTIRLFNCRLCDGKLVSLIRSIQGSFKYSLLVILRPHRFNLLILFRPLIQRRGEERKHKREREMLRGSGADFFSGWMSSFLASPLAWHENVI